jgi:hypothetical protein
MGPSMSVCRSRLSWEVGELHDPWSLLEYIVATVGTEVIVSMLQQWEHRPLLGHIVITMGTEDIFGLQRPQMS